MFTLLLKTRQTWPVLVAPRPAARSEPPQPLVSTDRSQISAATTDYSIWLIAIRREYVCIIDSRVASALALGSQPPLICKSALSKPSSWRGTGVYHLRNYRPSVCLSVCRVWSNWRFLGSPPVRPSVVVSRLHNCCTEAVISLQRSERKWDLQH